MEEMLSLISEEVLPHWPFLVVTLVFTVVGKFTSAKLFTRSRAYRQRKGNWYVPLSNQWFWWWGRETLSLHPIITGVMLGLLWKNPEMAQDPWPIAASIGYFAGAGVLSLFVWSFLKSYAKSRGIDINLPGGSERPGESPPDFIPSAMPDD